jgi:4-hydroxy-tetrahydrodipicolinate synthase
MTKISGIFAASMSVLNHDLSLNVEKTIEHAEKLIDQGCHGTVLFGSTGQAQLIPISEKIKLLNNLSKSKFKDKHLIGTGLNSLNETINFLKIAVSLNFKRFLIMPPAYYKYQDNDVINFYTKIIDAVPECEIVLYNFEKLSGYKFSIQCVEELVQKFPKQIVGVKDSSYNLFENLKLDNFSVMPGSEAKLLKGLEHGCSGIITATCNATSQLARRVYDDFVSGKEQSYNQKLIDVRNTFEKYNLISSLHTFFSYEDEIYKNLLPPLSLLNEVEEKDFMQYLKNLNFKSNSQLAA